MQTPPSSSTTSWKIKASALGRAEANSRYFAQSAGRGGDTTLETLPELLKSPSSWGSPM